MDDDRIRPIVLGLLRRDEDVLLAELYDSVAEERFYRPIGGEIEFGESSRAALVREFEEELGLAVEVDRYLGTIENRFSFEGARGHEVAIVHEVELIDDDRNLESVTGYDDGGTTFSVTWQPPSILAQGAVPVYPDGLLALLTDDVDHVPPSRF